MYITNEITGENYYFDPFEKWWHYFLLFFAYFVPHKLYIIREESLSKIVKKRNSGFSQTIGILCGIFLSKILQEIDIPLLKIEGQYMIMYGLIVYLSIVMGTVVMWKIIKIKEYEISQNQFIDVQFTLLSLNTLWDSKGGLFGICLGLIVYFYWQDISFSLAIILVCLSVLMGMFVILFGKKTRFETINGEKYRTIITS